MILILLIFPFILSAQSFEGELKFSIELKGKGADQLNGMAPSYTKVIVKNKNTRVKQDGMSGMLLGDFLSIDGDENTYVVNDNSKTIYKFPASKMKSDNNEKPTVTLEKGKHKILSYDCKKYKVVLGETTIYVWATEDISISNYEGRIAYEGVKGFIVKQELPIKQGGLSITMTTTLTSMENKTVEDSNFELPKDYKVVEDMPDILKMQMKQ